MDGLKAMSCPSCKGNWVNGTDYFDWLDAKWQHAAAQTTTTDEHPFAAPRPDSDAGKLCLDCGRFMRRVAVGHGKTYHLDRCTSCGGFWFDAQEWESLRASGLHREAHQVFTDAWQAEVRREARKDIAERRLTQRLGVEGLARLNEIKSWVAGHPRGAEIIASLTAKRDD